MATEKTVFDAWLAGAELPYDLLIPLLHEFGGADAVFSAWKKREEHPLFKAVPPACRKRMNETASEESLHGYRDLAQTHGIQSVTILEEAFPHCLRDLPDPPGVLFFRGNPQVLKAEKPAAMVGSRSASWNGLKAAERIAEGLSRAGVTVISGLALGIDAASHKGCLKGGSPTVAVMGGGLDKVYPPQNEGLMNDILKAGGLLISEYAPGVRPSSYHFPYRNRIISGLADAVILMEAKVRSGSMTTVGHALRQGKEVFAYPGDPVSPLSEANRLLLREGARYFTEAKDVLEDMNWLDNLSYVGQNIECSPKTVPDDPSERAVYLALEKGNLGFDELIAATGLTSSALMSTLTVMQIRKAVEILPGKRYQLVRK